MEEHKNIVGPQVRQIRYRRGMKQKDLAAKLQRLGWWIDRAGVSKIEGRLVRVNDYRQLYLARVLRVGVADLFPVINPKEPFEGVLDKVMNKWQ